MVHIFTPAEVRALEASTLYTKYAKTALSSIAVTDLAADIGAAKAAAENQIVVHWLMQLLEWVLSAQGTPLPPVSDGTGAVATGTMDETNADVTIRPADGDLWRVEGGSVDVIGGFNGTANVLVTDGTTDVFVELLAPAAIGYLALSLPGQLILSRELYLKFDPSNIGMGESMDIAIAYHKVVD